MIEQNIRESLKDRVVAVGESVQYGWFVFWVDGLGPPITLRSLDFKQMASFTNDLSKPEAIHVLQQRALMENWIEAEEPCSMLDTALVSKSYSPGREDAVMKRDASQGGRDSGWYIGLADDPLDLEDPSSFEVRSLYELSIKDERMYPFWTFPSGTVVLLEQGIVQ